MKYKVRVGSGAAMHWIEVEADNAEHAKQEATKQGGKAYAAELVKFSPDHAIAECKGEFDTSGINWSYAKFSNVVDRTMFIKLCNDNGYRTRSERQEAGYYLVQYHHYAD